MYPLFTTLGIVLAAWLSWRQRPDPLLTPAQRTTVQVAAVAGAIIGAHLLQWPATAYGWTAPEAHAPLPLAGRTVLGGLIGGWLAVLLGKKFSGIRTGTGDGFAAPLAIALAIGRLGCWFAGCCAGQPSEAWCALPDADGVRRLPVQLVEAGFHALACAVLLLAARRGWLAQRRLAWYLLCYAGIRFALEYARTHPPLLLGLSWYQFLALGLAVLCAHSLMRRSLPHLSAS